MYPFAHMASTVLVNRLARIDRDPRPGIAGALVPDIIDKTLSWVLGLTPTARHIGHTPLAALALAAAASAFVGRRKAAAFGTAYLVHLVGDLREEGHVPWLMPFKRYHHHGKRWGMEITLADLAFEALGAAYLLHAAGQLHTSDQ